MQSMTFIVTKVFPVTRDHQDPPSSTRSRDILPRGGSTVVTGRKLFFAVSLLLLASAPVRALAVDIKTQSSTQYLWYNDPFQDKTQGDLLQYVKFSATKIDAAGRFSTVGYGRVSKQFGSSGETDRGDSDDVLGRIYFLYMNYAIPEDRGDVRLGRQFVSVGAGSGTIDGVRVDMRNYGPVAISLFGGYDVRFAETSDRTKPGNYLAVGHSISNCAGCHMAGPSGNWNLGGHSLAMQAGSDNNTTGCVRCHGSVTGFDVLNKNREGTLTVLLDLLETTLTAKGVVIADPFVYPYFTGITTQAELRAAYNYKFVSGDPGAHVHNWRYAAQLLYDSAYDLDNTVVFPGDKADFFR